MKHIVIFDEFNEVDLKPSDLLREYLEMTERDVGSLLVASPSMYECVCPGCLADDGLPAFKKFGMQYIECSRCHTLFVSPRPDDAVLREYYESSPARKFWRETLSLMTGHKRKEKIIKPRFEWIEESMEEYFPHAAHIADLNTDQCAYVEEMANTPSFEEKTLLYPLMPVGSEITGAGFRVVRELKDEEALAGQIDVVSLFEVADRVSDVNHLFQRVNRMLRPGGLCFMTDILISGFDLQVLWDHADNIFPPDRLNLFSIEGMNGLSQRHDFECIELSTPGILDVEIVEKAVQLNADISISRFIRYFLSSRGEDAKRLFQEFLQMNLLSSYGRVLLRKK